MRITSKQLRQIIREELSRTIREGDEFEQLAMAPVQSNAVRSGLTPEIEAKVKANLALLSDFTIRRAGPGAWVEAFNVPGTGMIRWEARGSLIIPTKWIGDDGKTFSITLAASIKGPDGKEMTGLSMSLTGRTGTGLDRAGDYGAVTSEDAAEGMVNHITNKIFTIRGSLNVDGSPGGGTLKRQPSMMLSFEST